jgi:hypothetical protein
MKNHLTSDEIAAAVAGFELETAARDHLVSCVVCRAEVADLEELIAARREEMVTDEPDWADQTRRIMARLPSDAASVGRRRSWWLRPVLALAAALVVAVGIGLLRPDRPVAPPAGEPSVEKILAEMDELLADDSIPGFEIIDPDDTDLETYFDNGAS